ncbi:MAG: excinuclease ABC subunit UvrB [bacterium]|nr:excinuclease ABC subunit UvrB [bacterium]
MSLFKLKTDFQPTGDQPRAIEQLTRWINQNNRYQTLLGVTGSGKTFTIANVIAQVNKPTLVIAHNKTLAAQLYAEFKEFFPENAVEYFVSYYDYYQPEAYLPHTDTYIEKDASINDEIDKLRHRATVSLLTRRDCIIVASVSCIYGLGSPEVYQGMVVYLKRGMRIDRDAVLKKLVDILYERNETELTRGKFRVRGDIIEIFPADMDTAFRIEFFGDEIDRIVEIDPLRGIMLNELTQVAVFPAKHWVTPYTQLQRAIKDIQAELKERIAYFQRLNKLVEAQRLEQRTNYDIELILELGYCNGIENYSRHLSGRPAGSPPETLVDYLPEDGLVVIDESHVTIPQIHGMYAGDRSRKTNLVEYGFRLPSAYDNRPLTFDEFHARVNQFIFVSATPGDWELKVSEGHIAEQIVRPTGLLDPEVKLKPVQGQIDDLLEEIRLRIERKERVLVTTLTKRMAEDLTEYLAELGIRVRYLHSVIETLERVEILRGLRLGEFDVLVGVNLLREGLDLPEVSLVAILDADKEGYLRSHRSLIQTIGRAARNERAQAIFYADRLTESMRKAIEETNRRRQIQLAYNQKHNIVPKTILRRVQDSLVEKSIEKTQRLKETVLPSEFKSDQEIFRFISELERKMKQAAKELDFEKAAQLRDQIIDLKNWMLGL